MWIICVFVSGYFSFSCFINCVFCHVFQIPLTFRVWFTNKRIDKSENAYNIWISFIYSTYFQLVNRILKPSAQPYTDLVTAFLTHNPGEVVAAISRNQEVFRRDNNFGLVKQVRAAQTKLNIQRLTKTFLTLSLADVAARVQLSSADEAEKCILSMVKKQGTFFHDLWKNVESKDVYFILVWF